MKETEGFICKEDESGAVTITDPLDPRGEKQKMIVQRDFQMPGNRVEVSIEGADKMSVSAKALNWAIKRALNPHM